jgi:hypothetical protein
VEAGIFFDLVFRYLACMKNATFLLPMLLLASCQGTATNETAERNDAVLSDSAKTEQVSGPPSPEKPQVPARKLPSVSIYGGRSYDDQLQRELNERNRHHREWTEVMTLLDAFSGEDGGIIRFRDSKGKEQTFASWPYDTNLQFDMDDDGDELADAEKGKKYQVTDGLRAYWGDSEGGVVEEMVVKKMTRVSN